MNRTVKITLLSLVGVILLIATVMGVGFACLMHGYATMEPSVQTSSHALTYEEAITRNPSLPATASNVWFASSSVGMGGRAQLYRFDASAEDCLAYANKIIRMSNNDADPDHQISTELTKISAPPAQISQNMVRVYGLSEVDWFDINHIQHGYIGRGPPMGLSSFWIDTDRNRFYYYWTD